MDELKQSIKALKAQAFALEDEGRTELAARARRWARQLEKQLKAAQVEAGKEQTSNEN